MTDLHLHNYDEVQAFLQWEQDMIVQKEQEKKLESARLYDQWNNSWTLYRD